jgi:putative membrane protein
MVLAERDADHTRRLVEAENRQRPTKPQVCGCALQLSVSLQPTTHDGAYLRRRLLPQRSLAASQLSAEVSMKNAVGKISAFAGAALLLSAAQAASTQAPDKFLSSAMQDGRAEVAACQLALTKAASPEVKAFAERMIKDHSETDSKIAALAQTKHYKIAAGTTLKQKASYEFLKQHSGAGFDKAFMEHNVSDHKTDVKDFSDQAQNSHDADVKIFAAETLVTLKEHLSMAQQVALKTTMK